MSLLKISLEGIPPISSQSPFNAKIHNSITDGLTDAKGPFNDINYAQVLFLN